MNQAQRVKYRASLWEAQNPGKLIADQPPGYLSIVVGDEDIKALGLVECAEAKRRAQETYQASFIEKHNRFPHKQRGNAKTLSYGTVCRCGVFLGVLKYKVMYGKQAQYGTLHPAPVCPKCSAENRVLRLVDCHLELGDQSLKLGELRAVGVELIRRVVQIPAGIKRIYLMRCSCGTEYQDTSTSIMRYKFCRDCRSKVKSASIAESYQLNRRPALLAKMAKLPERAKKRLARTDWESFTSYRFRAANRSIELTWCKITKELFGNRCVISGSTENLCSHHLNSVSIAPWRIADILNCAVITRELHREFHNKDRRLFCTEEDFKEFFFEKTGLSYDIFEHIDKSLWEKHCETDLEKPFHV